MLEQNNISTGAADAPGIEAPQFKKLYNHTSPETAYIVDDYPYGFRLRCRIRYWLEYSAKRGFRFVSQTTNPKKAGEPWNKPKASTYCRYGAAMYLNEKGHVTWQGVHEYSDLKQTRAFMESFGDAVPEAGRETLNAWRNAQEAYELQKQRGEVKSRIVVNGVAGEWKTVAPEFSQEGPGQ